jgi:transcription antitermination factor NusG
MAAHVLGHWTMRNVRGGQRQFWIVVATKSLAGRVAVSCITEQGYPNYQGYIEPEVASPPQFKTGESVEATRGIFQDKFGQYVGLADQRGGHRVKVLFEIMGRQAEYEISAFDLAGTSLAA